MMVINIPQYIKSLDDEVQKWRATCKEEDRGDGFKEGTPNYILDFRDMTLKFWYGELRDTIDTRWEQ